MRLIGLFAVLAVDVVVVISDFRERLHDYGLKFYAALQGIDPFYALKRFSAVYTARHLIQRRILRGA